MEKRLGYNCNKENEEMNFDEREAKIVKVVFDLKSSYSLHQDEIFDLITKNLTLDQIINFRIHKIQNTLLYDFGIRMDFGNILDILVTNKDVNMKLIKPLLDIKEQLTQENNLEDNYNINKANALIEQTVKLLKNKNNILDKYNNFNNIIELIIDEEFWNRVQEKLKTYNLDEIEK